MNENKSEKPHYLPDEMIRLVMARDSDAIAATIEFYDGYMEYLLDYMFTHYHISRKFAPREDMLQEVRMELFKALKKFE